MKLFIGLFFVFLAFVFGLPTGTGYFVLYLLIAIPFLFSGGAKELEKMDKEAARKRDEEAIRRMVNTPYSDQFVDRIIKDKVKIVEICFTYIKFDKEELEYSDLGLPTLSEIELKGLTEGIKAKLENRLSGYIIYERDIMTEPRGGVMGLHTMPRIHGDGGPSYYWGTGSDGPDPKLLGYRLTINKESKLAVKEKKSVTKEW